MNGILLSLAIVGGAVVLLIPVTFWLMRAHKEHELRQLQWSTPNMSLRAGYWLSGVLWLVLALAVIVGVISLVVSIIVAVVNA